MGSDYNPQTARSFKSGLVDDNLSFHINIKWLLQIFTAIGFIVYGYVQIENRITDLESRMGLANTQIEELISKHIIEENAKMAELSGGLAANPRSADTFDNRPQAFYNSLKSGSYFAARREEEISSTNFFVRVNNIIWINTQCHTSLCPIPHYITKFFDHMNACFF